MLTALRSTGGPWMGSRQIYIASGKLRYLAQLDLGTIALI